MQITLITLAQLCVMFTFMTIGYFFRKKNMLCESAGSTLSKLVVNIFLPSMIVLSFSRNFNPDVIQDKLMIFVFSLVVLIVTAILSIIIARFFSKNKTSQGIYMYSFTIPNLGYMAYPLSKAIFGESAFLDTLVYCLPYSLFIYTFGVYILTSNKKITFKTLLNPTMVAAIVGIVMGLAKIQLPAILVRILETAEGCVTPCAMILTGTVFARINMKSVFLDPRSYIASAIRLLIIPIAALFVFRLLDVPNNWVIAAISVLAMPMGVNSVIFPEAYGGDAESGAKVCFMSAVLALVTIPIVFSLL